MTPKIPTAEKREEFSRAVLQGLGIDAREGHPSLPIARTKERKRDRNWQLSNGARFPVR